jgi:hypothetical protein
VAYAIPSADFLALCLFLCEGNPDASIAQVIERAEQFQAAHHCCFGVSDGDFANALRCLAFDLDLVDLAGWEHLPELLARVRLRDWIAPMLAFDGVYFNDEGEYWTRESESREYSGRNRPVRALFAQPAKLTRDAVDAFLAANSAGESFALYWSDRGDRCAGMVPEKWQA